MNKMEKRFLINLINHEIGKLRLKIPYCDKLKPIQERLYWLEKVKRKIKKV